MTERPSASLTTPTAPGGLPESGGGPVRPQVYLPTLLLGWGLGVLALLLVRTVGGALLTEPCEGRTLLALVVPLLLGPGGLAFAAVNARRPRRATLGLGFMVASLLPGLLLGVQDIGKLRGSGCAGGYVVFAPQGGKSVTAVNVPAGGRVTFTGRLGGYRREEYPAPFTLRAESSAPGVQVVLPKTQVYAGEVFPVEVIAGKNVGVNAYTLGLEAKQVKDGRPVGVTSTLTVNVQLPR